MPFGLLWWPWLGPQGAALASLSFLLGGLWLSPDLDTLSRPTARWGPLALLWWPYRRLLSHRSLFSHGPLIGSALRLLYLLALVLGLCLLGRPLGFPSPGALLLQLQRLALAQPFTLLAIGAGVEASAWLHLIQDGDPLPRLPRPLRPLLSRRRRRRR